jgi:2-keto-4-pentenoate hydratase/2-oxohepta-3-ene-1,7-dioic acid hydratase in catechol pathway
MRFCRYWDDRLGVVLSGGVVDITDLRDQVLREHRAPAKGDAVISALPELRRLADTQAAERSPISLDSVHLLSPVKSPTKFPSTPANYQSHRGEIAAFATWRLQQSTKLSEAGLFLKATSSMVGPSEGIRLRFLDRRNDHEVELAVIIGTTADRVNANEALKYVAGYCIGLDITLRGPEDRSFRKSIDTYSVLGPWMETADVITDPDNLDLTLSVNGEPRQKANTRDMIHSVPQLIEFASSFYTLYPGDVIFTGTPSGVGPIKSGDVLTAEIESIGKMTIAVTNA